MRISLYGLILPPVLKSNADDALQSVLVFANSPAYMQAVLLLHKSDVKQKIQLNKR